MSGRLPEAPPAAMPNPSEGFLVTLFLTVRSVDESTAFYCDVLGGEVVHEADPCIIKLANSWLIMNPGGGPTPDKPGVELIDHAPTTWSRAS